MDPENGSGSGWVDIPKARVLHRVWGEVDLDPLGFQSLWGREENLFLQKAH